MKTQVYLRKIVEIDYAFKKIRASFSERPIMSWMIMWIILWIMWINLPLSH